MELSKRGIFVEFAQSNHFIPVYFGGFLYFLQCSTNVLSSELLRSEITLKSVEREIAQRYSDPAHDLERSITGMRVGYIILVWNDWRENWKNESRA